MLTTTQTVDARVPTCYELYHACFREFLNADYGDSSASSDDQQPYDLLVLADELRQAAITAHNRICEIYLTCFVILDDGLPY